MGKFSIQDYRKITDAFTTLAPDAAESELENFVVGILQLNPSQRSKKFPDGDPDADKDRLLRLDLIASRLVAASQHAIAKGGILDAVIIKKKDQALSSEYYYVLGLEKYLAQGGETDRFINRTKNIHRLRAILGSISKGLFLEALTAAILRTIYTDANATQGTNDQGIDCLAKTQILPIQSWCCAPDTLAALSYTGSHLHIVTSCKANEGSSATGTPDTISPAHIRELIGAWMIQRSSSGAWQKPASISLLAPIQLLLSTTYKLSDASSLLCKDLGVAVWGITELIYLIIRHAPESVFPPASGHAFDKASFDAWVLSANNSRLMRTSTI